MLVGVQGRISYVRACRYVGVHGCGRVRSVCQDFRVYMGTLVFEGVWTDQAAELCEVTSMMQEKNMVVSGAWYEESVVICKLGGPRRRVWELSGLGVVKRVRRSTNCVPKRVWKAEPALTETSFQG